MCRRSRKSYLYLNTKVDYTQIYVFNLQLVIEIMSRNIN